MSRCIADLLNDYGITHNLPSDNPILNLPLSQFKENEYYDLISIVLFYDSQWFDPAKIPSPERKIGELSLHQSTMFYTALRDKVASVMNSENLNSSMSITLTIPNKYGWVTPTQMTYILSKMPLFTKMMKLTKCDIEYQTMVSWINNSKLSAEEAEYLDHLLLFHALNQTQKTAEVVVAKELFKGEKFGYTSESFELLQTLLKKLQTESSDLPEAISGFFLGVVNVMIRKFGTPIRNVLLGIGATIPENLPNDLALLLNSNIEEVPDLRDDEWTNFIYFLQLFVHQYAVADPVLLAYSYTDSDEQLAFQRCAEEHNQQIIQRLDQQQVVYQDGIAKTLGIELQKFNVTVHPRLLALFCFEQCEPLKQLFSKIWKNQGIQIGTIQSFALLPNKNQFTLGDMFYDSIQRVIMPTTRADARLIAKLKHLSVTLKARESGAAGKFFDEDSKREPGEPRTRDEFIQEFNTLSEQVVNPKLKPFLNIESFGALCTTPAINFPALADFVFKYQISIDAEKVNYPPTEILREFHQLAGTPEVYNNINLLLEQYNAIINLQDTDHLQEQLDNLDKRIKKLTLLTESAVNDNEESKLRMWWLKAQLNTYQLFKVKVEEKLGELLTTQIQAVKVS